MPGLIEQSQSRKRKRLERSEVVSDHAETRFKSSGALHTKPTSKSREAEVLRLEDEIIKSRQNYNSIANLITLLEDTRKSHHTDTIVAVSLCRIFTRLAAAGSLTKAKASSKPERIVVQWLRERYSEYFSLLLEMIKGDTAANADIALALSMRLLKDVDGQIGSGHGSIFPAERFESCVRAIVDNGHNLKVQEEFINKFVTIYDDIRFYTFSALGNIVSDTVSPDSSDIVIQNTLVLLSAIEHVPASNESLESFYILPPKDIKAQFKSLRAHKKKAQSAWLALLRSGLTKEQRDTILGLMSHQIAPWFVDIELLMDFLTDCYNIGGSTSLLALSGLYYLIQEKNLDYPSFYQKLYTLLDAGLLHSRHRSRFFRLLDEFLSSTHLPAALVASFIKRLSRFALFAPPAGIIAVVPWVYNLLRKHPTCTFMIHRETTEKAALEDLVRRGIDDPFNVDELDPMETNAIDSSLWELETLQSHFHPNIASLARIISEQFTKQSYNIEDFLDHSYGTMIDAELEKDLKKPPIVESLIPKRVLFKHEAESTSKDGLLVNLWSFE